MLAAAIFLFGLAIGSFLNVCIRRIPRDESVVSPASRCPACRAPIKPYDNIPVLSWLLLGGRCRNCRTRISPLYPVVELLTGLLFLACYFVFGATIEALKWVVFSGLLVVLTIIDWRKRILPDKVNFTGFGLGLGFSLFVPVNDSTGLWVSNRLFDYPPPEPVISLADALAGGAVGIGFLFLVPKLYYWVKGVLRAWRHHRADLRGLPWQKGMGLGDLKMMLMVGAFFGPKLTLLVIFLGSLLGSALGATVVGLLFLFGWKRNVAFRAHRKRLGKLTRLRFVLATRYRLPFGTFLGAAALLVVFFGRPALEWYLSLLAAR